MSRLILVFSLLLLACDKPTKPRPNYEELERKAKPIAMKFKDKCHKPLLTTYVFKGAMESGLTGKTFEDGLSLCYIYKACDIVKKNKCITGLNCTRWLSYSEVVRYMSKRIHAVIECPASVKNME